MHTLTLTPAQHRMRAAWLAAVEQWHRAQAAQGLPIWARGRRVLAAAAQVVGNDLTHDAAPGSYRTWAQVQSDALACQHRPGNVPAAWNVTRRPLPFRRAHRVAPDWAATDTLDVQPTGVPGVYVTAPRRAATAWEYLNVTPSPVADAVVRHGDAEPFTPAPTISERVARVLEGPPMFGIMVPADVVAASAADPCAYYPRAAALQHAANDYLREHGDPLRLPDVFDRKARRYHVRPDRVAYRGQVRVKRLTPCQYERAVTDRTATGADGQAAMVTRLAWWVTCKCGAARRPMGTPAARKAARDACGCIRHGWTGHVRTTFGRPVRAERVATREARPEGTGARGPVAGSHPWSMSPRSLPRAVVRVAPVARALESILRAAEPGALVTFGPVTVEVLAGGSQVIDPQRDRAYPTREWCQRAALDGIRPD